MARKKFLHRSKASGILKKINTLLLVILIFLFGAYIVMSPPSWVVYKQLSAIRSGNLIKAYKYTSPEFQALTSFDDFESFLEQNPSIKNSESLKINEENQDIDFESRNLTIKGLLKNKEGLESPVIFELVRKRNFQGLWAGWKIKSIKIQENGLWKTISIEEDVDSSEGR